MCECDAARDAPLLALTPSSRALLLQRRSDLGRVKELSEVTQLGLNSGLCLQTLISAATLISVQRHHP